MNPYQQGFNSTNPPPRPSFSIQSTAFEPGEALLFTADAGNSPYGNRFWGDPYSALSNNLDNFQLSCSQPAPFQGNFYLKPPTTVLIPDAKINDVAYQVYAQGDGNNYIGYKLFFYQLFLHKGSNNRASDVTTDMGSFAPLQTISQTEDGSSGSDAPWYVSIPPSSSDPLRRIDQYPVTAHYRFKWGHRVQWLNDTIENQSVRAGPYNTPYLGYNTIANHNMRAPWHMRSPVEVCFRASAAGGRYTHGITLDDPYGWDWRDTTLYPVPVSGKNRVSPFGRPADYNGQTFPMLDIPTEESPLVSLGSLQHAPLSVFPWHPTYVFGNGMADPRVERNVTTNYFSSSEWQYIGIHSQRDWKRVRQVNVNPSLADDAYLYDISYETNHALWDRYFLSTLPGTSGYSPGDPLANPRLVLASDVGSPELSELRDFHRAARHFTIKGGFNINSTSETAWAALLASFRSNPAMEITLNDGTKLRANDIYSRLRNPYDIKYTNADEKDESMWKGYRQLTDIQINELAREVVREVKRRGPFVSIADFVNRRLVDPPERSNSETPITRTGLNGTLQAAIDRTSINNKHLGDFKIDKTEYSMGTWERQVQYGTSYPELSFPVKNGGSGFGPKPDHNHWADSKLVGAPSYLSQADILQKVGPVISARGDTFVIRSYGEALGNGGKVLARAYCEAIVQRTQDAIAPDDAGLDPDPDITTNPLAALGRKFKIVSFRWLNPDEI
ncbi:MAG: hypothetical protein H7A51_13090 [Akkermansiaceae bacterium]|nr:hypothetical protein [Akkermansiaceae bacterium]